MSDKNTVVGLIPARGGSKRVPGKNIRLLNGRPLIAHAIKAARDSGIFVEIIVSTEDEKIAEIARENGALVPFMRPAAYASEVSPDIEWVFHALKALQEMGKDYDAFSILRPTSPFRTGETIKRAWKTFLEAGEVDSLRAVEKCHEHPCKMWVIRQGRLLPLLPFGPEKQPWHSSQYQSLPEVYVQNASLEIAWSRVVFETGTIAGAKIIPFLTEGYEGFDINSPEDWALAEKLIADGAVKLNL